MVIRTRLVELSSLEAVAYRQKLRDGQSGVVILRSDTAQPGLALLNHQTGEPDPAANTPAAHTAAIAIIFQFMAPSLPNRLPPPPHKLRQL